MFSASQQDQPTTSLAAMNLQSLDHILSIEFLNCLLEASELKNNPANYESVKTIEIKNCPTTLEASKLISNLKFQTSLESFKNSIILILKINGELNEQHAEKPKVHDFKLERNFLISYESVKAANEKIIYWKNGKEGKYLTINLRKGYSTEMTDFVRDFLIANVNMKLDNSINKTFELANLNDSNNLNLVMKAVESEHKPELIKELLKLPFNINQKSNDDKSAADIAYEKKSNQTLLLLLEEDSTFPKGFNIAELEADEALKGIKEILNDSSILHEAVAANDQAKVEKILDESSNLIYFYNLSNVSAATAAIKAKNMEIYRTLLVNDCSIGPEENFNQIMNELPKTESDIKQIKKKLLTTHDNSSQPLPERHLMMLCANSIVCHDDKFARRRFKHIKDAFKNLNEIPIIQEILQLISIHKNFKIYFDFNRSSVEFMNPFNGNLNTRGLCDHVKLREFYIYIAAKELLTNNEENFAALGTLAHELCHFSMNLIFCNDAKPYAIDDEENKVKFDGIIKKCKGLEDVERIVSLVFDYEQSEWPAELIVRVPHMIVHYQNDSKRLNELKATFKDLFDYYNDVVAPKMNQTQSKINKIFNHSNEIKFSDLTDAHKAKLHQSEVSFQGTGVKFNEIIEDKNSEIFQQLNSKQIRAILIENKSLTIGWAQKIMTDYYTERAFIDFKIEIKNFWNNKHDKLIWTKEVLDNLISYDQILSIAEDKKMILLTDHAGAGKTTTFIHLSVKLKGNFPNFWISYIDLKRHLKIYEKNKKNFQVLKVLQEILSITDQLEIEIFTRLYKSNRVILLYDGVDEIAPKFNDFFIKFIESVRNSTKNQQWIATRPQHMQELKMKFNQKTYKLLPFDEDEKNDLIENVLNNLEEIKNVDSHEVLSNINGIKSRKNDINSPLILKMLTELYVNDETSLKDSNLFSLYDKMIELKVDVVEEKGKIVNRDRDNRKADLSIWKVHQIYALKLLYKDGFRDCFNINKTIDINELPLLKRWKKEKKKWTPEAISRYGFLIIENWNTGDEFPDFVHRTFAEYFAALFAIQGLYDLDDDDDDDDDKISEKEIKLRLKLLMKIGNLYYNNDFILGFIDIHKPKKMHKYFLKNITSNKMQKLLFTYYKSLHFDIVKILTIDERFLKVIRFNNKLTFFQYSINEYFLFDIRRIVNIYKRSLDADWINHTGYSVKENFSMSNHEDESEIINIIDQFKIPQNDLLKFFSRNFITLCNKTFENSVWTINVMRLIENNFHNCKKKFLKTIMKKITILQPTEYKLIIDKAKEFLCKLEEFFQSDETISLDDIKDLLHKT